MNFGLMAACYIILQVPGSPVIEIVKYSKIF
jgi:hypothetical protein